MIKYLIIDDEPVAHDIIQGYCDLLPNMQLVKNCYDAIEALEYLSKNKVDLLFLDLNLPKLKGFDFLRTLPVPPKVIVTTAYQEYALQGFELNVIDYLLKPFSFERFLKAINKVVGTPSTSVTPMATSVSAATQSIFLRSNKKYIQVAIPEIVSLEAAGNYTKVKTKNALILVREKISDLVNTLPSTDFLQVHKSFAVAIPHISSIEGNRIYIDEQIIPIGQSYKLRVMKLVKAS